MSQEPREAFPKQGNDKHKKVETQRDHVPNFKIKAGEHSNHKHRAQVIFDAGRPPIKQRDQDGCVVKNRGGLVDGLPDEVEKRGL